MLKQSDSQIIFCFMHDVVAYGNSSLCFIFKTYRYEKPINIFFDANVGLGHMHIMPTMTTVGTGTYCILIRCRTEPEPEP